MRTRTSHAIQFAFAILVLALALVACAQTPTPAPTPTAAVATNDAALEVAARQIVTALATVEYKNPDTWKTKLLALSNDDGQKFWRANFDTLLKDVLTHKRVTEKVTLTEVRILERQVQSDTQGVRAGAIVFVTGRVIYADDTGRHDEPINQPLLLAALPSSKNTWQFVALLPPSSVNASATAPVALPTSTRK